MRGATARKAVWLFSRRLDVGFVQRFVPIRGRDFDKKASQRLEASIISLGTAERTTARGWLFGSGSPVEIRLLGSGSPVEIRLFGSGSPVEIRLFGFRQQGGT